ncbi:hypothetical protein MKEN_01321700 [Mycena kentingensis (nom. inval.)]|nr:hypothetical protein MKEN_01321700 [Mycena kentingensis (nom. inval.)]
MRTLPECSSERRRELVIAMNLAANIYIRISPSVASSIASITSKNRSLLPTTTNMHPALLIPEIVLQVVSQFSTWERESFLAFALVCRAFSGPALDALWRDPGFDALFYLMKCFPSDLLTLEETPARVKVTLLRPVMTKDWEAPTRYRSRVRSYDFGVNDTTRLLDILHLLAVWLPDSVLFPRLEQLRWIPAFGADQTQATAFLRLFLSSRLRQLKLFSNETLALSTLPTLTQLAPPLTSVRIGDGRTLVPYEAKRAAISNFLCSLDRVETLEVAAIDSDAFLHLAGLHGLESLRVSQFRADTIPADLGLPPALAPFAQLRCLTAQYIDVATAIHLIGIAAKSPLEELELELVEHTTSEDVEFLIGELLTVLRGSGLTKLAIRYHYVDIQTLSMEYHWKFTRAALVRLTGLPNLTQLTLVSVAGYVGLNNPTLLALGSAFPNLHSLRLDQLLAPEPHAPPELTLPVLVPLARACPSLSTLALSLSLPTTPRAFPSLLPNANTPTRPVHTALTELNICYTRIAPAARFPTARFLSAVFPLLAWDEGVLANGWEDAEMVDPDGDEQYAMVEGWEEVGALLPQLAEVRREEHVWGRVERGEVSAADAVRDDGDGEDDAMLM